MSQAATDAIKRWASADFITKFRRNANGLALRYGAPLWLVGGALQSSEREPRDYDLRIVLTIDQLERIYGRCFTRSLIMHQGVRVIAKTPETLFEYDEWEWRRGYDCLKVSRIMSKRMAQPIDFQIQTEQEASYFTKLPRLRLDTTPDWVLAAGNFTC